jgi:hypothetical protein|tara:strand:+ start:245 stop:547 length:303 start_codon:yes stop_codon:yes gene_type:complete
MDDVPSRLSRELASAIATAIANDTKVEACREKSRAAGFEMRISIEAVIGFVNRLKPQALAKVGAPAQKTIPESSMEMNANDRRFLRSLRIAVDETPTDSD